MPTRYIGDGYWEIASRQMSIVTRSEQERFKDAKITVIGCGGIGGETIEMLARMVLENLYWLTRTLTIYQTSTDRL